MGSEFSQIGLFILILIFGFCVFIALENIINYKKTGKIRYQLSRGNPPGKWGKSYGKPEGKRAWFWNIFLIIFSGFMVIMLTLALLTS